jgi:hypothetical protein
MLVNTAIGFAFFAVAPDQTTVVQPVDITGTSQGDNIPVYINGTTVSSSLYFPYRSGTSATTNGYFANSTGAYTPATASYWAISNGQNNWWSFVEVPLSVSVPAGYSISTEINFQVVSDADTIIQTTPYSRLNSATTIYTNDQTLESYVLKANVPYTIYMLQFTGGEATVTHEGYLIRNLVGSTRVDIVSCNFTTFARRVSLI